MFNANVKAAAAIIEGLNSRYNLALWAANLQNYKDKTPIYSGF